MGGICRGSGASEVDAAIGVSIIEDGVLVGLMALRRDEIEIAGQSRCTWYRDLRRGIWHGRAQIGDCRDWPRMEKPQVPKLFHLAVVHKEIWQHLDQVKR
ncbi:hypothetical protein GOP47_0013575 [Adiantum capillus-veneris]|uniref:Uncharacterized protein n=1 Tax=Adiantum capillus-veneris TaxID=13818 RepID=A0A9D4UPB3_ADICA|nr:hypothetical protein GOP47_0013575 [Adiantum capillus-veneris]